MSKIGEVIKERVNKVLPKVFDSAEKSLGHKLPKVKIQDIDTYSTGKLDSDGEYKVSISGVFVDAIISKKDGSFGKIKKLVLATIENVLVTSGYEYREIYVTYERGEPSEFINESDENKSTEKLKRLITNQLEGDKEYTGKYMMPYSSADDEYVDFIIKYHIDRVSLWKGDGKHCQYEGTIYVTVEDVIVGFEGTDDWERGHRVYDLPSWVEDDFKDSIQSEVEIYGKLCLDVDYRS
jgi:hypothetical protein